MDNYRKGREMNELSARGKAFRAAIAAFIDARREAKLKDKDGDTDTAAKYDYPTWLADAAKRVSQIQSVTHVLKATHPDARGSSLHVAPSTLPQHAEIGSHLLGKDYAEDVVGNAAAAFIYSFLTLEVEGKRLLDWMQAGDADLQAALTEDVEQARNWMQAFASLVRTDTTATTHPMAKQLYWLTGNEPDNDRDYQLLQPMFASSLAHCVYKELDDTRFGEASKIAKQAKKNGEPGDPFRVYMDVVEQYFGAPPKPTNKTKHLNISHLNAERMGRNYLLASLPPAAWKPREGVKLLNISSVFDDKRSALTYFGEVRDQLRALADFLKSDPDANADTRKRREAIEQALGQELAAFGASVRGHQQPGWSRHTDCKLPLCEKLWLDPERSELPPRNDPEYPHLKAEDEDFIAAYERGDWADEVAARFGLWLNHQLRQRSDKLAALSDAEMRHFARQAVLDVAWPIPLQRRAKAGAA